METPLEEDPPPEGLSVRDRMAWVLRMERGRVEYGKRKITAEPVFGQMKGAMGFGEFLLRGHRKVQGEWKLASAAHNVLKLFRAGVDPRALAGLRLGSEAG